MNIHASGPCSANRQMTADSNFILSHFRSSPSFHRAELHLMVQDVKSVPACVWVYTVVALILWPAALIPWKGSLVHPGLILGVSGYIMADVNK